MIWLGATFIRPSRRIRYTKSVDLADWRAEYPSDDVSPGFRIELKDYAAYDYRIQNLLTKLDIG